MPLFWWYICVKDSRKNKLVIVSKKKKTQFVLKYTATMGDIWLSSQGGQEKKSIFSDVAYASKQSATTLQRIVSIQRSEE